MSKSIEPMNTAAENNDLDRNTKMNIYPSAKDEIQIDFGDISVSVDILFGVTQDGGGVVITNGHFIRIPPMGSLNEISRIAANGFADIFDNLALNDVIKNSRMQQTIRQLSFEMQEKAFQNSLQLDEYKH